MPIIYSLVARGTCVLAEYTTTSGNFATITRRLLDKLPREDSRMSYVYDSHVFHYMVLRGLVFLCMSDEEFSRRVAFAFLEELAQRWTEAYGDRGKRALAYGMNNEFSHVLKEQMEHFSRPPVADRLAQVGTEIDEVRAVMVENIEKVLERGEKIELLVDKTEQLNHQAFRFKRTSTAVRRTMWCKNVKISLLLLFVLLVIAAGITFGVCGFTLDRCGGRGGGKSSLLSAPLGELAAPAIS